MLRVSYNTLTNIKSCLMLKLISIVSLYSHLENICIWKIIYHALLAPSKDFTIHAKAVLCLV